jgi:signal transduction histidine kinase
MTTPTPATAPVAASTAVDPYVAERRQVVRQRLRWTALVALVPISFAVVVNVAVFWERLPERLLTLAVQAAVCALAAAASFHRSSARWATLYALALSLTVATLQFRAAALAGQDVDVMVVSIVVVMLAATLLYPWGLLPQAVLATYTAVGYLMMPDWTAFDPGRIANVAIAVALGAGLSMWGAFILDRQRRATFAERERVTALAHQRELLLDAGRELNAVVELDQLVPRIARLVQRVVDCDVVTVTLIGDRLQERYPIVGVARDRADVLQTEVLRSGSQAFRDTLLARHVVEIPGGTEFDELAARRGHFGTKRVLVVAVQREGRLLAVLALGQRTLEPPFSEQRIRLAEGIAHQAAIALANARLVDDLQRANRVKSEFVSTMSHELRTPLNVILGFAEMGRDVALTEAERAQCFGKIDLAGKDLLDLIESTLAIGKLEAGRDAPVFEDVALGDFWRRLGAVCERLPRNPAVALEWPPAPAVPVRTDPRKLTVVLRNLVSNALKFTEQGQVRVTAELTDGVLALTVADTGIGIPVEHQQRVFEMFRQGDGSDSRRFGGTGLGLYIVQQYVGQLGGAVALESAPGQGARFTVQLPLDREARSAA